MQKIISMYYIVALLNVTAQFCSEAVNLFRFFLFRTRIESQARWSLRSSSAWQQQQQQEPALRAASAAWTAAAAASTTATRETAASPGHCWQEESAANALLCGEELEPEHHAHQGPDGALPLYGQERGEQVGEWKTITFLPRERPLILQ